MWHGGDVGHGEILGPCDEAESMILDFQQAQEKIKSLDHIARNDPDWTHLYRARSPGSCGRSGSRGARCMAAVLRGSNRSRGNEPFWSSTRSKRISRCSADTTR